MAALLGFVVIVALGVAIFSLPWWLTFLIVLAGIGMALLVNIFQNV